MSVPEPIRQALMFQADQERTFTTFATRLSTWMPVTGSRSPDRSKEVRVEEWGGGRIFAVDAAGREHEWGLVTSWNPPHSFSFVSGALRDESTEIDLRFQRLGPALTRVVVEHRGWERMSSALYDSHTSYVGGWLAALRQYAALFETENGPGAAGGIPPQAHEGRAEH